MFEQWLGSEKRKIDSTKLFAAAYLLHVHQKFTPLLEWAMPCSRWSGEYLFLSSSLLFLYHSSSHPRLLRDLLRCLRNFSMEFHFDRMENVWIVLGDVAQISFLFLPSIFVYSLITNFFLPRMENIKLVCTRRAEKLCRTHYGFVWWNCLRKDDCKEKQIVFTNASEKEDPFTPKCAAHPSLGLDGESLLTVRIRIQRSK